MIPPRLAPSITFLAIIPFKRYPYLTLEAKCARKFLGSARPSLRQDQRKKFISRLRRYVAKNLLIDLLLVTEGTQRPENLITLKNATVVT